MTSPARPTIAVAVVMDRETKPNRWEDWRHSVTDVVLDEGGFGDEPVAMTPLTRPTIAVAVVMDRETKPNRWEDWRHSVTDVVLDEGGFGDEPTVLRDDGQRRSTLHPGFQIALFRDEGEGYYLNLSSGAPAWFVVWRADDEDPGRAWPETVSVSYNEAGRWLDAQEHVEQLPMPDEVVAWLQAYTNENYRPEPKKRRRPQSFLPPEDRRS